MMQRRGFLGAILAAGFAPAAVGSGVLMPVRRIIELRPIITLEDLIFSINPERTPFVEWELRRIWDSARVELPAGRTGRLSSFSEHLLR